MIRRLISRVRAELYRFLYALEDATAPASVPVPRREGEDATDDEPTRGRTT